MTRGNHLVGLHHNLLERRQRLSKKLTGELAYLHDALPAHAADSADLAFEMDGDEISSRLAELDERELNQIDRALGNWIQGTYGVCEDCSQPISLARLGALPHTTLCIRCERTVEKSADSNICEPRGNWDLVADGQALMQDPINLKELELQLTGDRWHV